MATVTRERELLRELVALVRGECPSLLNEDSGGDVRLSMAIDDALAAPPASEYPRIVDASATAPRLDPETVADALGAAQAPPASDPPGLLALVREYQALINGYGDGEQKLQELDDRLAVVQEQLLAYPLPASPQAETTKGDE